MTAPDLELVHPTGCAKVPAARRALAAALSARGMPRRWTERLSDDPDAPDRVRHLPSPTVLVNGQDVTGVSGQEHGASCRSDLAGLEHRIGEALEAASEG